MAPRGLWWDAMNDKTPLEGTKHPIEYYFEILPEKSNREDGVYSLLREEWDKPPRTMELEFDFEKMYPEMIAEAEQFANEMQIDLGEIQRDVNDVERLDEIIEKVPKEERGRFLVKLKGKLEHIEREIEELVQKKDDLRVKRRDYKKISQQEVAYKYAQRHLYLWFIKQLEELLEKDGGIQLSEIPEVKKILRTSPKDVAAAFIQQVNND